MKRDPNRAPDITRTDHSLPKSKILRGKRNFQRLFERSTVLKSPTLHLRYRIYKDPDEGCLIGFTVRKKLGNAVTRNRIKRLLREAYRTNQHYLTDLFATQSFGFHGVLMAQTPDITLQNVTGDLIPLLERARQHLLRIRDQLPQQSNSKP